MFLIQQFICSYFSVIGPFAITGLGKSCPEDGKKEIRDKDECKSAWPYIKYHFPSWGTNQGQIFCSNCPKGCYASSRYGYFNTHSTVVSPWWAQSICQAGRNFKMIILLTITYFIIISIRSILHTQFKKSF